MLKSAPPPPPHPPPPPVLPPPPFHPGHPPRNIPQHSPRGHRSSFFHNGQGGKTITQGTVEVIFLLSLLFSSISAQTSEQLVLHTHTHTRKHARARARAHTHSTISLSLSLSLSLSHTHTHTHTQTRARARARETQHLNRIIRTLFYHLQRNPISGCQTASPDPTKQGRSASQKISRCDEIGTEDSVFTTKLFQKDLYLLSFVCASARAR